MASPDRGRTLRVTAWMQSPIAGDVPMLDAVLEFEMAQRQGLATQLRRDQPAPQLDGVHIPIAKRMIGGWNVPCCSGPIYRARGERVERFAKRLAVEHADALADSQRLVVATGNSTLKSYRLPLRIVNCERVVYICRGHRRPVLQLLKSVSSIGHKRSIGYGRVEKWSAEYVDERSPAWWYVATKVGAVLMRPLPWCDELPKDLVGFRRDFGSCVAPYWHPERYTEIVRPC